MRASFELHDRLLAGRGGRLAHVLEELLVLAHRTNLLITKESRRGQHKVPVREPRLGVRARVVDGQVDFELRAIHPFEALDEMELLGVGMTHLIEPRLVVQPDSIDDERVAAFVAASRMSPPLRIGIVRMLLVQPDDAEEGTDLVQDVDGLGRLNEPRLEGPQIDVRNTRRLAVDNLRIGGRLELRVRARRGLLRQRLRAGPWLIRDVVFVAALSAADVGEAEALSHAASRAVGQPVAGQVCNARIVLSSNGRPDNKSDRSRDERDGERTKNASHVRAPTAISGWP